MAFATNFKSDQPTRLQEKTKADASADQRWRAVCRTVDARDGLICRVCRRRLTITVRVVANRRERHHIIPKSLQGPDESWNVANVCLDCHQARHVTRTLHNSGNADKRLRCERDGKVWHSVA